MKTYQITRMKCQRQQHYDITAKAWVFSEARFSGTFEATPETARAILAAVQANQRTGARTQTTKATLNIVEG